MRKLLAITVAIAVIGGLAVTMLADKQVLSFSEPFDTRVENATPSNQVQPQDFAGAGSQFYYFGPNFMCQIFTDTTVVCYGSDTHGVVSSTPNITGFTNVDGGDTYACAFHQATRSNYCWGSISLSPTTIQPEPTIAPTVEPTIEPTVDPTVEPTTVVPTVEPTVEPPPVATNSCRVNLSDSANGRFSLPVTKDDEWVEECTYTLDDLTNLLDNSSIPKGNRYSKYTAFIFQTAVPLVATLESVEDTVMLLWEYESDDNGNIVEGSLRFVEANDDLVSGNTNSRIAWTTVAGKGYILDMTTYELNTLGDFTLTLERSTVSSTQTQNMGDAAGLSDMAIPSNLQR